MKNLNRWIVTGLMIAVPQFVGCQRSHDTGLEHVAPSHVVPIEGTDLHKVTWTKKAAERTGLKTGKVTETKGPRSEESLIAVPYSSILYTTEGKVWVYELPEPLTFVRHEIEIDYIAGDLVYLEKGPPVGTEVATVGVAEIYGSEFEVGH